MPSKRTGVPVIQQRLASLRLFDTSFDNNMVAYHVLSVLREFDVFHPGDWLANVPARNQALCFIKDGAEVFTNLQSPFGIVPYSSLLRQVNEKAYREHIAMAIKEPTLGITCFSHRLAAYVIG